MANAEDFCDLKSKIRFPSAFLASGNQGLKTPRLGAPSRPIAILAPANVTVTSDKTADDRSLNAQIVADPRLAYLGSMNQEALNLPKPFSAQHSTLFLERRSRH
jgi:hypothetical protein